MGVSLVRTVILYLLIIIAVRLMGKRQIGELQPTDLVVTILISELAAIPMQDTGIPILYGIIPILALISSEIIISYFSMKSIKFRYLLEGRSSIIIKNGIINQAELQKQMFTLDDLMEELRLNGVSSVEQVHTAIMETNGKLSVFLKSENEPPPAKVLNISVSENEVPFTIISDGRIISENLNRVNITEDWVNNQLMSNSISDIKDVFFMCVDSSLKALIIPKEIPKYNN